MVSKRDFLKMINLYRNPELKAIMFENIKYWMDLGVDGFRFDAVTKLIEDERYLLFFIFLKYVLNNFYFY